MTTLFKRCAAVGGTLAVLAAGHLGLAPRQAEAGDRHAWGISTLGDTCSGTCAAGNICCRIVIIAPDS